MSRARRFLKACADPAIALLLATAYVALLLSTVSDLGYARDEGFYFRAANQYRTWFEKFFADPSAAMQREVVDRYWKANHEHPAFVKSLFALSNQFLFRELRLFTEEGTSFRFPGMVLSGMAVATTYLWGRLAVNRLAGLVAALLLAMMPRVFYHSHLDCFDMPVVAMWLVTTFVYWLSLERGGIGWALLTGVLYGFLLNTKHNAWLLPPALIAHFVVTRGFRGLWRDLRAGHTSAPLALFFMATLGPAIFYCTWPWIWNDTVHRLRDYVAFHTGHEYYNMEFLGVTYFEPPMPRLYAWVMTLGTVPAITLLLFAVGLFRAVRYGLASPVRSFFRRVWRRVRRMPRPSSGPAVTLSPPFGRSMPSMRSTSTLWLLCLLSSYAPWFSSNTPIFGGTKHWMTAYPFMTLFAGVGFDWVVASLRPLSGKLAKWRLVESFTALAVLAGPVVMTLHSHPWGLTFYTPLVGGAPGAASLGLNRSFWGYTTGAVTGFLNEHAKQKARVYLHDTAQESWSQLSEDGRVREDLSGTLTLHHSDIALYHHEQHMARVEYQLWVTYGTTSPVHVGTYDGVPVIWLYERGRREGASKNRVPPRVREPPAPASADGDREPAAIPEGFVEDVQPPM